MSENMIPEGKYRARGVAAAMAETNDGKPQIAVSLRVEEDGDFFGYEGTWYGHFTEKAARRTLQSLKYLGWEGDDLSVFDGSDTHGIDRNEVELVVEHDTYNGETKAKFAFINRPGGLAIKAVMDEGKRKAFAQRMKGLVLDVGNKMKQPATGGNGGAATGGAKPSAPAARAPAPQRQPAPAATGARPKQSTQDAMQLEADDIPF